MFFLSVYVFFDFVTGVKFLLVNFLLFLLLMSSASSYFSSGLAFVADSDVNW